MQDARRGKQLSRRYPALAYLVAAGAMALLLPSALTLPRSGPETLAEYAPVPGDSEGAGDVSEFGSANSGGPGFGTGGGKNLLDEPDTQGRTGKFVRRAGTKKCVGDPPRQTEDPLSPPCIAFFEGDNGGNTSKGVTHDEVTVILPTVNSGNADQRTGELIDCADAPTPEDDPQDLACRAYLRYFNLRYQTYGRTVKLWSSHGLTIEELEQRHPAFAQARPYSADSNWAKARVISTGYQGSGRASYRQYAPYFMSFRPDEDDLMAISASAICNKLAGQTARYSGNASDLNTKRVFGFWHDDNRTKPTKLVAQLKEQCGLEFAIEVDRVQDTTVVPRMKAAGVTTVVALLGSAQYNVITSLAAQQAWFPEWFIPGDGDSTRIDTNSGGRVTNQAEWANAFGVTTDYRRDAIEEQHWYRAYREGCPDCPAPQAGVTAGNNNTAYLYDTLAMLFTGIQAAGPKLTPQRVDDGLHSLAQVRSASPYKPAAYFAPGNYSLVKDATLIWWDPSGRPPGSGQVGCWRLPNGGTRYRVGEFPAGDSDLRAAGPCQGDTSESA